MGLEIEAVPSPDLDNLSGIWYLCFTLVCALLVSVLTTCLKVAMCTVCGV